MEKTLYLSENQTLRIRRDGPSLWVQEANSAARRVPARLVRRAIVVGNVPLDSASLTLLAQRGVPVALLDRRGEPLAMVLGLQDGTRQRRVRQAALSENREKRERVAAWLDAWERGRQLRLIKSLDPSEARLWRCKGYRQIDYEDWVLTEARMRNCHARHRTFLTGALHELIAAEIVAQGWNIHSGVRELGTPLGFVKDCYSAMQPDMDRIWLTLSVRASESGRPLSNRALAGCFESARTRLEALLRLMLEQYARLLWEI
jgi:hypothetical protein